MQGQAGPLAGGPPRSRSAAQMDGCPRQNPAYRPATERPRPAGPLYVRGRVAVRGHGAGRARTVACGRCGRRRSPVVPGPAVERVGGAESRRLPAPPCRHAAAPPGARSVVATDPPSATSAVAAGLARPYGSAYPSRRPGARPDHPSVSHPHRAGSAPPGRSPPPPVGTSADPRGPRSPSGTRGPRPAARAARPRAATRGAARPRRLAAQPQKTPVGSASSSSSCGSIVFVGPRSPR